MIYDRTYIPYKASSVRITETSQCNHVNVTVPYLYADQMIRLGIFTHGRGWKFQINARGSGLEGPTFDTKLDAANAVLEAIQEQIKVLSSITLKDLIPEGTDGN